MLTGRYYLQSVVGVDIDTDTDTLAGVVLAHLLADQVVWQSLEVGLLQYAAKLPQQPELVIQVLVTR